MNNQPVAWMDEDENVVFEKCKAYPIPLYTHPEKALTDEEIEEVFCSLDYGHSLNELARALLRKAQEK